MSITFSGMASGLPVNDIIDQLMAIERRPIDMLEAKKANLQASTGYLDNVETRVKNLATSLQKFTDGNITASMDLFQSKKATSSDDSILTVTAGSKAANQSFEVNVLNIATSTKVESLGSGVSTGGVGALVDAGTTVADLGNGSGTGGKFTIYYNNVPTEVTINSTDTIGAVIANINGSVAGVTASIAGGIITLASAGGTINVGANGDTSNFLKTSQLDVGTYVGNDLNSANPLSAIKTSGLLVGNGANLASAVGAGDFTIGEKTFTIDATTTLDSLLNDINNSADAGVTASYNLRTNKIELTSKDPGKVAITLSDGGSNFLQNVNLITGGGDTLAYQTLGDNARIQINGGAVIESTSNTITDSVTGIKDVTLTLRDDSAGSNITVNIQQDTDALVSALKTFVTNFNNVIKYIDEQTNPKTGNLPSDNSLVRFRNNLRKEITDIVSNSPLMSLASVGITTGKVGTEGDATGQISFDESVFLDKLATNPDDVRALFIGNTAASITGVMQELETFTDAALDTVNGFFKTRDDAIDRQIKDIDESILRAQDRLDSKEKLMRQQFAAMESAISQLSSQSSYISNQLSSTSSK